MSSHTRRKREEDQIRKDMILKSALGAGVTSGITGAGFGLFTQPTKRAALAMALKTGLMGAAVGGGSIAAGTKLLGLPSEEDSTGYTRRGSVGGSAVGGTLGAAAGALLGSGLIKAPKGTSVISNYLRKFGSNPSAKSAALGALVGGGAGGMAGGYMGNDEGLMLDFINEEAKQAKKRRILNGEDV